METIKFTEEKEHEEFPKGKFTFIIFVCLLIPNKLFVFQYL